MRPIGAAGSSVLDIGAVRPSGQMEPFTRLALNATGVTHAGRQMIDKFAPPKVFIRRRTGSEICDVVVLVRGQEIILRCPDYSQALKWARLECKSYKIPEPEIEPLISESEIEPRISESEIEPRIPEPEIEPLSGLDHDEELPLFLRSPRNN
jgi:hypothetical protein